MTDWTDDFNRADETPLNIATWGQSGTGSFNLTSNAILHPADAGDNEVYYIPASAMRDQYAQGKVTGLAGGETGCGIVCRHIGSSTRTFIRAVADSSSVVSVRVFTNASSVLVGTRAGSWANNDVLRMEVSGTSPNIIIRIYKNGVQVGADFTGVTGPNTGKPGMCYSSQVGASGIDDWAAGDFVGIGQQVAPIDSARTATTESSATTSHTINVGSPVQGDLLIVLVRAMGAPGTITFTGYTQIATDTTDASDDTTSIYYRWADGTEGASDPLSTVNSIKLAAICWRVTGAENPAFSAPTVSTVAIGTTTANTANPGSVAPAGAPRNVLYLALMGGDGVGTITAAPTNYGNLQTAATSGSTAATNGVIAGASRQITATSSDDPGAFTHAARTTGWTAYTVAVRGPKSLLPYPRISRNILLRR